MGRTRSVEAGAWLTLVFGVAHTVLAGWGTRAEWDRIRREGWWDTARLRPTDRGGLTRAMVLWETAGSFGGPCAALGAWLVWAVRHGQPVPRWVGGVLLGWSVPLVVVLPRSPSWVAPVFASLLLAAPRPGTDGPRSATTASRSRLVDMFAWRSARRSRRPDSTRSATCSSHGTGRTTS